MGRNQGKKLIEEVKELEAETERIDFLFQIGANKGDFKKRTNRVAIEQCHQRWHNLFFGIWDALLKHNPKLAFQIVTKLKENELAFRPELFEMIPSKQLVNKLKALQINFSSLPELRGKTRTKLNPFIALRDYTIAFYHFKDIKPLGKTRNPSSRLLSIKEHIPIILNELRKFDNKTYKEVSDKELDQWINMPNQKIALSLIAYFHNVKPDAFQKIITEAKKLYPTISKIPKLTWKS